MEKEQEREKGKECAKMPQLGLGWREPGCRKLEAEPTAEHAAGSNTAAVAVVFVVVVVAVVEVLTTVEQCNST